MYVCMYMYMYMCVLLLLLLLLRPRQGVMEVPEDVVEDRNKLRGRALQHGQRVALGLAPGACRARPLSGGSRGRLPAGQRGAEPRHQRGQAGGRHRDRLRVGGLWRGGEGKRGAEILGAYIHIYIYICI